MRDWAALGSLLATFRRHFWQFELQVAMLGAKKNDLKKVIEKRSEKVMREFLPGDGAALKGDSKQTTRSLFLFL